MINHGPKNVSEQSTSQASRLWLPADFRISSVTDHRNWDYYHRAFSRFFDWIDGDLADPDRFPKGERKNIE